MSRRPGADLELKIAASCTKSSAATPDRKQPNRDHLCEPGSHSSFVCSALRIAWIRRFEMTACNAGYCRYPLGRTPAGVRKRRGLGLPAPAGRLPMLTLRSVYPLWRRKRRNVLSSME
jgi:hypothetical protein